MEEKRTATVKTTEPKVEAAVRIFKNGRRERVEKYCLIASVDEAEDTIQVDIIKMRNIDLVKITAGLVNACTELGLEEELNGFI